MLCVDTLAHVCVLSGCVDSYTYVRGFTHVLGYVKELTHVCVLCEKVDSCIFIIHVIIYVL